MNAEANFESVEQRARLHAVLADPARLRIVDRLGLGDASPTELGTELGMPSNLTAHHVGVLERAGLVVRHRSEADRRRSYLRLVPGSLDEMVPAAVTAVPRVVFVCTANSARSQLAAALWARASNVPAASGGTHPAGRVASGALAAARRHGLRLATTRPHRIDDVLARGDFVVTVCDHAHEELHRGDAPVEPDGWLHWSVPDPVRVGTDGAFDAALGEITERIARLSPRLTAATALG